MLRRVRAIAGAALVLLACSGKPAGSTPDATTAGVVPGSPGGAAGEPEPPPYGADVKSLRLKRSIVVRHEPRTDAKAIGTVAADTRVGWRRGVAASDCPRWIEIDPRGWVCDRYLEPDPKKTPAGVELPKLKQGEIVPGVYGRVRGEGAKAYRSEADVRANKPSQTIAGEVTVRRIAEVTIAGKPYWKTSTGELIEARKIRPHVPSQFAGVRPGDGNSPQLPLGWAQSRKDLNKEIPVYDGPDSKKIVRKLPPRTVVPFRTSTLDGTRVQIGENEWVARDDLHLALLTGPPPTLLPGEKWFDVDLDEQVVVAYEGERPVYATLISSGNKKWPTPPGIYRIWIKFAETDMNGQMGDEQPYSVATVPWTMFFAKDLAFHTAYWHDKFGQARSHGCINLSPRDARVLYFWADPDVPPGWSMSHGIVERPGSMVRIRTREVSSPEFRGYATRVYEARGGVIASPAATAPDAGESQAQGAETAGETAAGEPAPATN